MARRDGSSARSRARQALAQREAAQAQKAARITAATESFYEKLETVESLVEQLAQAEVARDQAVIALAGEGLTPKEIAALTELEPKTVKATLKSSKPTKGTHHSDRPQVEPVSVTEQAGDGQQPHSGVAA